MDEMLGGPDASRMTDSRRKLIAATAKEHLSTVTAEDLIGWAVEALLEGVDTPAVRTLAGLDLEGVVPTADAVRVFQRALRELGIPASTPETAVREYLRLLADDIVSRKGNAQELAKQIRERIVWPADGRGLDLSVDCLDVWCDLAEGLRPVPSSRPRGSRATQWGVVTDIFVEWKPVSGEHLDSAIREVAQRYLREGKCLWDGAFRPRQPKQPWWRFWSRRRITTR